MDSQNLTTIVATVVFAIISFIFSLLPLTTKQKWFGVILLIIVLIVFFIFIAILADPATASRDILLSLAGSIIAFTVGLFIIRQRNKIVNQAPILGRPFRRYFATMLNRPFYSLPDQVAVVSKARQLLQSRQIKIIALSGAAGVGKTTMAAEIIRHIHEQGFLRPLGDSAKKQTFEDDRIEQIDRPAYLNWDTFIDTIIIQLGTPSLLGESLDIKVSWVKRQINLEKQLLLIDNLESTENTLDLIKNLRQLLSRSSSKALITYRYRELGEFKDVASLEVSTLDSKDSLLFMDAEIKARGVENIEIWLKRHGDKKETVEQIIKFTQGLPLALQLVMGLSEYMTLNSIYQIMVSTTDMRVEKLYEFLYLEELKRISANSRKILIQQFTKKEKYSKAELVKTLNTVMSIESIVEALNELSRVSLLYSVTFQEDNGQLDDYFFVHPMLHQFLNSLRGKTTHGEQQT